MKATLRIRLRKRFRRRQERKEERGNRRALARILGGSVAKWSERWTCNSEALSSSPALTASWICSRWSRLRILGHAC